MKTETLKESLLLLKEARQNLAGLKAQKESAYQQWLTDNAPLIEQIEGAILEVNEHELYIRDVALSSYKINQDKHPCPGVEIKEFQELRYNKAIAFNWAKDHYMFLELDEKGFEKFAKNNPLDFVEVATIPKVQIATDLEKVLQ